jgi:hypothetical protein
MVPWRSLDRYDTLNDCKTQVARNPFFSPRSSPARPMLKKKGLLVNRQQAARQENELSAKMKTMSTGLLVKLLWFL